ncbi:hypothetical protein FA95DRAFT_1682220 [Auriscalpium vulgare]|uniref:Uncharacterized protein n=1 Tax=Auriscalpium vulgare TaxID=40419 RepID=A0ACB8RFE1_9AGAM|nr:hypothetical protein FA95DRAFT_1682220 [Auriscalpium vulgare]
MFSVPDTEVAQAQHSLRRNPAAMMKRARNGSMLAFEALTLNVVEVPAVRTATNLRMFCSSLSASNIPPTPLASSPSTSAMYCIDRAFFSLRGVSRMVEPQFIDTIADAWPGVFAWLKFFNDLLDSNHPVLREDVLKVVGMTFYTFSTAPPPSISSQVAATPNVMVLAASLWLKETDDSSMLVGIAVCSAAVDELLSQDVDGDLLEEFVQHAGGWSKTSDIADIAVSRLRGAICKPLPQAWQVDLYINVMAALSDNDALCSSILDHGGIRVVIRALTKQADLHRRRELQIEDNVYKSMEFGLSYIMRVIDVGSIPCVRQAVRAGLFHLYIALAMINAQMPASLQDLSLELLAKLAPYFIYHSVFSLCDASYPDDPAIWKVLPNSSLKTSLETVYRRAAHHTQLAQRWEASKDIVHCDNCEKNDSKHAMKWCAGCRSVFYCSEECQKAHWETIHRVQCDPRRAYHTDSISQPPSKADRRFHTRYVIHDAINSLAKLRATTPKPLSDIGISIDYTKGEPSYSTYPLKHYKAEIDDYPDDEELVDLVAGIIEQARSDKGRTSLIESRVTLGYRTKIFFTLVSPPIWDAQEGRLDAIDFRIVNVAAGITISTSSRRWFQDGEDGDDWDEDEE